jgi:hypothetical protein
VNDIHDLDAAEARFERRHGTGFGTAFEAGLVGVSASNSNEIAGPTCTFKSVNYQTLTDLLDAVLAMPSGY